MRVMKFSWRNHVRPLSNCCVVHCFVDWLVGTSFWGTFLDASFWILIRHLGRPCFRFENPWVPHTWGGPLKLTSPSTILSSFHSITSMIVKTISPEDHLLLQRLCHNQWHFQTCYSRYRALEVISAPPDTEVYKKFVYELVSCLVSFANSFVLNFSGRSIFIDYKIALARSALILNFRISSSASIKKLFPCRLVMPPSFRLFLNRLPF